MSRIQVSAGPADAHRRGQLRNLAGRDLQAAGRHLDAAEIELVDEGVGLGETGARAVEVLGPAEAAFSREAT